MHDRHAQSVRLSPCTYPAPPVMTCRARFADCVRADPPRRRRREQLSCHTHTQSRDDGTVTAAMCVRVSVREARGGFCSRSIVPSIYFRVYSTASDRSTHDGFQALISSRQGPLWGDRTPLSLQAERRSNMHLNRTNQQIASHFAAQALEAALQSKRERPRCTQSG